MQGHKWLIAPFDTPLKIGEEKIKAVAKKRKEA
jgi:hypothetical protein